VWLYKPVGQRPDGGFQVGSCFRLPKVILAKAKYISAATKRDIPER